MGNIPSYTRILTLGSTGTEAIFDGVVSIQEKVDGSQFRFGKGPDGRLVFASHNADIYPESCPSMFKLAVDYIEDIWPEVETEIDPETYYYCEYLAKPKHNTLAYDRTPKNHLVLFGGRFRDGLPLTRTHISVCASLLNIDPIPYLHHGVADLALANQLLATESYLGGTTIEGVVIKNYGQQIVIGGHVMPLFAKHVRKEFKERNASEWKRDSSKNQLQQFVESFCTEARWHKAVQHLEEAGQLEHSPRDIGLIMKAIHDDVITEDADDIKETLYKLYIKDIVRAAQRGAPEWYKTQLAERLA